MSVSISPLDLELDSQNPRFVILSKREQTEIRKYLLTYEDVCQLASEINTYGGLLPGERIVVLKENNKYIVIEGNRRVCSLQLLLSRDLVPEGFLHKIPIVSDKVLKICNKIEVDILPDRNAALELMSRRHIEGVKSWKPLAKKQFFAANFQDGRGQTVRNLSIITGIAENEIKEDICDYKFFFSAYKEYSKKNKNFKTEIINIKTDPFWRIFKAKFEYPVGGEKLSPKKVLKISYDENYTVKTMLEKHLFTDIVQLVFAKSVVEEQVNTRSVLSDVEGILPFLEKILKKEKEFHPDIDSDVEQHNENTGNESRSKTESNNRSKKDNNKNEGRSMGGGPDPRRFFETISWEGRLDPTNQEHQGLLVAIDELYRLSRAKFRQQKAYEAFPVSTGMILRTVYEQALRLQLMQVGLWSKYCNTLTKNGFPKLSSMEAFINSKGNKTIVFPEREMIYSFDRIIAVSHRDFLNANIHYPGNIRTTSETLEGIANGGMYHLIQSIINQLS
ncbi:MAG: hypothetical protein LBE13_19625 [Bacteroidales bacterium]|nr:hypothetical protein [Bacteroidales bacterium]